MRAENLLEFCNSQWADSVESSPQWHVAKSEIEARRACNAATYHRRANRSPCIRDVVGGVVSHLDSGADIRSVLEVAAGTGVFTIPLAHRVERVTVVDSSPSMLRVLRTNLEKEGLSNVEIVEGRWPEAFSEGQEFDLALAANCLLAFRDLRHTLACMLSAARKAICLINPLFPWPLPREPEVGRLLRSLDRGSDVHYAWFLLGVLSGLGVHPSVSLFEGRSWEYPTFEGLYERWEEALNLETPEDRSALEDLLRTSATQDGGVWTLPGFSMNFLMWAQR